MKGEEKWTIQNILQINREEEKIKVIHNVFEKLKSTIDDLRKENPVQNKFVIGEVWSDEGQLFKSIYYLGDNYTARQKWFSMLDQEFKDEWMKLSRAWIDYLPDNSYSGGWATVTIENTKEINHFIENVYQKLFSIIQDDGAKNPLKQSFSLNSNDNAMEILGDLYRKWLESNNQKELFDLLEKKFKSEWLLFSKSWLYYWNKPDIHKDRVATVTIPDN